MWGSPPSVCVSEKKQTLEKNEEKDDNDGPQAVTPGTEVNAARRRAVEHLSFLPEEDPCLQSGQRGHATPERRLE